MDNYHLNNEFDLYDETDDETDDEYTTYEPEEPTTTKFNIVLCAKYNKSLHGRVPKSLNSHYLTFIRFKRLDMQSINMYKLFSNILQLEIAECTYLSSDHCVSIIKTFWLKIIQRTWKRIFKERKLFILKRMNLNALKHKEIYGKYKDQSLYYPSIKGMLCNLSRTSF
jgi:hypothetical protein